MSEGRTRRRVDYRTLTVLGFVLVALAVLLVVVDNLDARRTAAQEVRRRDAALTQAQGEARQALEQSRRNGDQLDQVLAQNNQLLAQVSALRRQLESHGLTPVDPGQAPVAVPPVSTGVQPPLARPLPPSPLYRPSAAPSGGDTPGASRPPAPTPGPRPHPSPSPSPSPSPTATGALPAPLPSPPPICVLLICLG